MFLSTHQWLNMYKHKINLIRVLLFFKIFSLIILSYQGFDDMKKLGFIWYFLIEQR
jgi:low temperature requirement protein LtrA